MDATDVLLRLLVATVLGAMVGLEREFDGQDAGFRTHVLVVLGAALFSIASVGGFDAYVKTREATNVTIDVTRIAAYVAPGIGFIGGGAILRHGGRVHGMTTAASLWTAAAVGVAVGLGMWVAAVAATVLTVITLEVFEPISRRVHAAGERRKHRREGNGA